MSVVCVAEDVPLVLGSQLTEKITEQKIQDALYIILSQKNHRLIVPNCHPFEWESDMVSVTRAGMVIEYEIKLTRSNFKQDFKKARHYNYLNKAAEILRKNALGETEAEFVDKEVIGPNSTTAQAIFFKHRYVALPSRFYYVVPKELITVEELPPYAGLMFYDHTRYPYARFAVVKEAPKIHSDEIRDRQRQQLERGLVARYWKLRLAANGGNQ